MLVQCCPLLLQLHSDIRDVSNGVCQVKKTTTTECNPDIGPVIQAFCVSTGVARDDKTSVIAMSVAAGQGPV